MDNLTPEESQRLKELREALTSEFHEKLSEESKTTALTDIEDLKKDFLDALKHIVKHSKSETLRAKVAMWGYDKLLDQGKGSKDPIRDLIDGMPAPVPAPADDKKQV